MATCTNFLNGYAILAISFFVLSIILYFAYPMYSITTVEATEETSINYSMFELTKGGTYWLIASTILGLCYGLIAIFLKNKIRLILGIAISILAITLQVVLGIVFNNSLTSFYYYLYFLFPVFLVLLSISTYRNTFKEEPKEEAI
ncbi:hypothetical protein [Anaeroplasma bactoclasticum]|nr:hypothetical protein [Anaeroplasma bactoclasticum]